MTLPLTNGEFTNDISGWSIGGSPSLAEWLDGHLHIIAGVGIAYATQTISTVKIGDSITLKYRLTDVAVDFATVYFYDGTGQYGEHRFSPGVYEDTFIAQNNGNASVGMVVNIGGEAQFDWIIGARTMAGFFTILMQDRDNDNRQFTLPATQVTAANHDAQLALAQALVAGIEGISLLSTKQWDFGARRTVTGDPKPSSGAAQANIEWVVVYQEATTLDIRTFRIGGAYLTLGDVLLPGSNEADLTQTEMAAFVDAFEAYVLGDSGNAVTVQKVYFLEN